MKKILLFIFFPIYIFAQIENENLPSSYKIDTLIHKVERKETLYSISKIYNVSIEDIKAYNPEIIGNKLKKKMKLNIPQKRKLISIVDKNDIFLKKDDTDFIDVSSKTINLKDSVFKNKSLKIGLLAPFKIDELDLDSLEINKKLLKEFNLTTISLDFHSGSLMALKKANILGINIDFNVGYGFTAIIVAFLGRLNPIGILFAGLVMALTYVGGELTQFMLNLPAAAIQLFQGMLLFFLLSFDLFVYYKIKLGGTK